MSEAYQPLHHKYRPQRLGELVGQEAVAKTLANALQTGRIAPAYLFSGPRGTGKTSSARILARSLNCLASEGPTADPCGRCDLCTTITAGTALDVIEIDAASNTGVDNIRELIERSRFAPVQARWKVYVVDECHMLSTAAFNALLKTLEEPPPRVVFVLATTDPQRVLPTILSRCQRFDFRRIPLVAMETHLTWIAERENIPISPEALRLVAQRAQGGLRDAESLLDQLSLLPAPIEPAAVWDLVGAVPEEELLSLAGAMAEGEPLVVVQATRQLLERGREPNAVLQGIVAMLRDLLLAGVAPDQLELTSVSPPLRSQLPGLAKTIGKDRLLHWHACLKGSEQQLRHSVQPRLWLEVILLGLLAEPTVSPTFKEAGAKAPAKPDGTTSSPEAPLPPKTPPAPSREGPGKEAAAEAQAKPEQPQASTANLAELWQQILAGLELPSTRMLLSQQAQLRRLDERRAVVCVATNWITMVQSRLPLLEKALEATLGGPRQITLEASATDQASAMPLPMPAPRSVQPAAPPHPSAPAAATSEPSEASELSGLTTDQAAQELAPPVNNQPQPPDPGKQTKAASSSEKNAQGILDEKASQFVNFFNGELIEIETHIEEN